MGSLDDGAVKRLKVCRGVGNHAVNLGVVRFAIKFGFPGIQRGGW